MSWRDYKDKKKKNILEENDNRQNQQKFVPKKETSEETKSRNIVTNNQQSMSTWDKVKNIANDTFQFTKNLGLGSAKGIVNALGQTEFMSQQKFSEYRKRQAFATKIKEQKDLKTGEDWINYQKEQADKGQRVNGIYISKRPEINKSATMKQFNEQSEKLDKMIEENTEKAQTKLGKFYTGQVAPSMGQSLTGTALDIVAPRNGFWI